MKRRDFIKWSGVASGCLLIPSVSLSVAADELVALDDPQAKALGYIETSEVEDQTCANCIHASGDLSAENVGCNLFPTKKVKGAGWCKVWAARP